MPATERRKGPCDRASSVARIPRSEPCVRDLVSALCCSRVRGQLSQLSALRLKGASLLVYRWQSFFIPGRRLTSTRRRLDLAANIIVLTLPLGLLGFAA